MCAMLHKAGMYVRGAKGMCWSHGCKHAGPDMALTTPLINLSMPSDVNSVWRKDRLASSLFSSPTVASCSKFTQTMHHTQD